MHQTTCMPASMGRARALPELRAARKLNLCVECYRSLHENKRGTPFCKLIIDIIGVHLKLVSTHYCIMLQI